MKSYSVIGKFQNLKYSVLNFIKTNQVKLIIIVVITLIAFVTGIFSAIKFSNGSTTIIYSDFGIKEFANGTIGTTQMFFQRFFSYSAILLILTVCSLTVFLFPVGVITIVYRGFLLGMNITFIVIIYGVSGIVTAILIIFPLQLLMLVLMILFFVLARNHCIVKGKYGTKNGINVFLLMLIFVLLFTLINFVETILLIISSAKVILII